MNGKTTSTLNSSAHKEISEMIVRSNPNEFLIQSNRVYIKSRDTSLQQSIKLKQKFMTVNQEINIGEVLVFGLKGHLKKGDKVKVLKETQNGWVFAMALKSGRFGWLPVTFLSPVEYFRVRQ